MAPILSQLDTNYEHWAEVAEREKQRPPRAVEVEEEGDIRLSKGRLECSP